MTERPLKIFLFLKGACLLWCLLIFSAPYVHAEALQWSGSIKSLNLYGEEAPANQFPDYKLSSNRARFNIDWRPAGSWRLESSLDYQYLWSDPENLFTLPNDKQNRHLDLDKDWQHGDQGLSRLQVDRLNLHWRSTNIDVSVGRQAVGFGRILIFSPLDVIAPFAPDALDTDIRSGVDAFKSAYNYGLDGQIGAIAVWGNDNKDNSFLINWTDNRHGLDLLMIAGSLRDRTMFGVGLAGSLGTLGLKGEFSVYKGIDVNEADGDRYDSYAIAAIETWYRFDTGISLITQYLYNGPGAEDPKDYNQVLLSAPLREGLTYLLGKHYLMVAPVYEIHPLVTAQGLVIYNIVDESALLRPTLEISVSDNISLQLFWTKYVGKEPRTTTSFLPAEPRSEFGLAGDSGGLFIKYFF